MPNSLASLSFPHSNYFVDCYDDDFVGCFDAAAVVDLELQFPREIDFHHFVRWNLKYDFQTQALFFDKLILANSDNFFPQNFSLVE